ncbi:hypothetical protein MuYL_2339 [Mucilaginibacter xinganensis]|uniref:Uncharacterized protein n=1 Tax=Mucilaginibacter xinganensis TaxID=1234841 RepID=A0A223NXB3_9SPHI|nr:hypothetical protein MuYL_2339 [Mucilaginibacter xinganensis]
MPVSGVSVPVYVNLKEQFDAKDKILVSPLDFTVMLKL